MAWTQTERTEFIRRIKVANPKYERAYKKVSLFKSALHDLVDLVDRGPPLPTAVQVQAELDQLSDKKDAKYNDPIQYLRRHFPGLDAQTVGNMVLVGFAGIANEDARRKRAVTGMGMVARVVSKVNEHLNYVVPNTVSSETPSVYSKNKLKCFSTELFQKWFDDTRKATSVNKVKGIFTTMFTALKNQMFDVVCYGTPEDPDPDNLGGGIEDAYAFVIPSENAYRMYLGSLFWNEENARIDVPTVAHAHAASTPDAWQTEKKTKVSMDASIVTMIHELTHVTMIAGCDDVQPDPYGLAKCKWRAKNQPDQALNNAENYAQFASAILMKERFF